MKLKTIATPKYKMYTEVYGVLGVAVAEQRT